MDLLADFSIQVFFQTLLAFLLGGLIGLEREYKRKEAGLRTCVLMTIGVTFFTALGLQIVKVYSSLEGVSMDPTRLIQAIAVGIGFLSGGIIIHRGSHIEGMTTAAGLWVASAIGLAIGARFYLGAILVTILTVFVLDFLADWEAKYFQKNNQIASDERK